MAVVEQATARGDLDIGAGVGDGEQCPWLKELFQPDLDFGIDRIMHAKSAEITQFLEKDLLPQVQAAFAFYKTADNAAIEKELTKVITGIEAAGMDPSQSPKVKELQAKLQREAVDGGGLQGKVYDPHHWSRGIRRWS